jgi:micrococcal nuclease
VTPTPFVYPAQVVSVYDGDTLTATLDLGMSIFRKCNCRLAGIDTPEVNSKIANEKQAALRARDRVRELTLNKQVVLESIEKPDKYGRLLVRVWTLEGVCVNDALLSENLAQPYDGGAKTSWEMT